jgi:hypothetical protein
MVSAVNNSQSSQSVLAPPPSAQQSQSSSSSQNSSFQDAVAQYTQDTTSGAGGQYGSGGTNSPSQTLSSDLMSSLLAMQS